MEDTRQIEKEKRLLIIKRHAEQKGIHQEKIAKELADRQESQRRIEFEEKQRAALNLWIDWEVPYAAGPAGHESLSPITLICIVSCPSN